MWRRRRKRYRSLQGSGKPYVIVLNSNRPYSEEASKLAEELHEKYQTAVVPVNCEQLRRDDVYRILEQILYEFPVVRVEFFIPKMGGDASGGASDESGDDKDCGGKF